MPDLFQLLTKIWGEPSIYLFASRLNAQVPCYASWRPNPDATYVDAFSISWKKQFFYAFPPFSLNARCLQKIAMGEAEDLMIVPFWPTQPWYSSAATLDNRYTEDTPKTSNHTQHARERTRNTSTMQKNGFVGVQIIRESLESQEGWRHHLTIFATRNS